MSDFSHPQRMSPSALVIMYAKILKDTILPLLTFCIVDTVISSSRSKASALILYAVLAFGLPLLISLILYFTKKFFIKDGNLVFIHGLFNRESTFVPLDRVHSLRTEKGILFRILGMRGIIFDTLATRQQEIELILDEYDWTRMLAAIENEQSLNKDQNKEDLHGDIKADSSIHYPTKNLLLAALCQNHLKGMVVLMSVVGALFGGVDDLSEDDAMTVMGWLETVFEMLFSSPARIAITLGVGYFVILIFWLGKTILRYYDTTMTHDGNLLTFTYGLLTRASCRFFHDKVCTLWIKRNFLEKKFGFATIMLRQALNASAKKEEDNMTLYGSDSSSFFLSWWIGSDYASQEIISSAKSGKGVFYRHIALRGLIAVAIGIGLLCDGLFVWSLIPALYLLIVCVRGYFIMRHSKIDLMQSYFIIHAGAFAEIDSYVKYSNIEVIAIRRTPLSRFTNRVSLALSTSGTTFTVRSLPARQAELIREIMLSKSEDSSEPVV